MRLARGFVVVLAASLPACGGTAAQKQADACAAAWQPGLEAVKAESTALTEAEASLELRVKDAQKNLAAVEKRLLGLTIKRDEAAKTYGEKVKGRVVASKMRVGTITPTREDNGKPLSAVRFDVEIQGEYKRSPKMLAALYEQQKAFFLDRVEVNITDEVKGWSIVKAQFHVYVLTEPPPAPPADAGLPAAYSAALAWTPPAECAAVPAPAEVTGARAELQAREALAKQVRAVEAIEEIVKARTEIADGLVRRRDDDRAVWTAHADELVNKAKSSVTGLAELRFTDKGEPDWRM